VDWICICIFCGLKFFVLEGKMKVRTWS